MTHINLRNTGFVLGRIMPNKYVAVTGDFRNNEAIEKADMVSILEVPDNMTVHRIEQIQTIPSLSCAIDTDVIGYNLTFLDCTKISDLKEVRLLEDEGITWMTLELQVEQKESKIWHVQ